jgi:hypothetical protein
VLDFHQALCNELPRGDAKSDMFSPHLSEFGKYGNVQHADAVGMWAAILHTVRCYQCTVNRNTCTSDSRNSLCIYLNELKNMDISSNVST